MKWSFLVILVAVNFANSGSYACAQSKKHHSLHKVMHKSSLQAKHKVEHKTEPKSRYRLVTFYKNGKKRHRYFDTQAPAMSDVDSTEEMLSHEPIAEESYKVQSIPATAQFVGSDIQAPTVLEPVVQVESHIVGGERKTDNRAPASVSSSDDQSAAIPPPEIME